MTWNKGCSIGQIRKCKTCEADISERKPYALCCSDKCYWKYWYNKNKENCKKRTLYHYYNNKEQYLERGKLWRNKNPEKVKINQRKQYIRRKIKHKILKEENFIDRWNKRIEELYGVE